MDLLAPALLHPRVDLGTPVASSRIVNTFPSSFLNIYWPIRPHGYVIDTDRVQLTLR